MKFSFLGRGQETTPLQLYGKLPVAKDYLRIGAGEGSGRALRDWLDATFGTVRDASEALILPEPLRFLGLGEKDPLQGCIWPSSDAGEHRKFPFAVFVERRRKALTADLEEGNLGEAEGVWRVLEATHRACLDEEDGQSMLSRQRGRDIDVTGAEEVAGVPADFDGWVAALWPTEGTDGLDETFERVGELARAGHSGPYRLPLVRDFPLRDQVLAWVRIMRTLGALSSHAIPTLFFPSRALFPSSEPAYLIAAARPLTNDEVSWLTADGAQALGPADLAWGRDEGEPRDTSPPDGDGWLRDAMEQALRSFGSRGREAQEAEN